MLSFLLDENVSDEIAVQVAAKRPDIPIFSVISWEGGRLVGISDPDVLEAAATATLTLVTYDRRTIPPLLMQWAAVGKEHGGVL